MAKLLFKLNGVPADEADQVRLLLDEAEIDYYETTAGTWGLSFAAIWLNQESDFEQASQLVNDYQTKRATEARAVYQSLKADNRHLTIWGAFKQRPIVSTLSVAFILLIAYFSVIPFFPTLF
ncbi:DUF6164 family protein [Aliikangiella sp. IMCC44653]